jgi:hypothetical protein
MTRLFLLRVVFTASTIGLLLLDEEEEEEQGDCVITSRAYILKHV